MEMEWNMDVTERWKAEGLAGRVGIEMEVPIPIPLPLLWGGCVLYKFMRRGRGDPCGLYM
jgi:hypothetical protein